jgi:glutaredoxin-like protein
MDMIENREGQKVPQVVFKLREGDAWRELTTDDVFAGKTVVAFALPGAFTPTCSSTHLPGYEARAATLRAAGVDDIVCLSVNDAFVMNAWGRDQGAQHVRLIADGNGDFARGMGMLVDKRDLGFGERSWRYSMLVRDGVIEKMFIEPEVPGDPFEVSDADTMTGYVAPEALDAPPISFFSRKGCSHCERARKLLDDRGLAYEEIELGDHVTRNSLLAVAGSDTTPQVFIGGRRIGGADELEAYLAD